MWGTRRTLCDKHYENSMNNQPNPSRKRAGAKPKPPGEKRVHKTFRLHPSTIAALDKLPAGTRNGFAESALRRALDLPQLVKFPGHP